MLPPEVCSLPMSNPTPRAPPQGQDSLHALRWAVQELYRPGGLVGLAGPGTLGGCRHCSQDLQAVQEGAEPCWLRPREVLP